MSNITQFFCNSETKKSTRIRCFFYTINFTDDYQSVSRAFQVFLKFRKKESKMHNFCLRQHRAHARKTLNSKLGINGINYMNHEIKSKSSMHTQVSIQCCASFLNAIKSYFSITFFVHCISMRIVVDFELISASRLCLVIAETLHTSTIPLYYSQRFSHFFSC